MPERGQVSTKVKCLLVLGGSGALWAVGEWVFRRPFPALAVLTVGTGLALLIALSEMYREQVNRAKRLDNLIPEFQKALVATEHSLFGLKSRFPGVHMPISIFSMIPANLEGIVSLLDDIKPKAVVEFGCGISTLYVAAWLREQGGGGRIFSFDHDSRWIELCRQYAARHGLEGYIQFHLAPLRSRQSLGHQQDWYDADTGLQSLTEIGLVIVDGPPAGLAHLAVSRLPAMEAVHDRLAKKAVVFLDDGDRPGEREVVDVWKRVYPEFRVKFTTSITGYWTLSRGMESQG